MKVRKDPDQLKAAQMVSKNPITIISGRGGTGKTEVVVAVLNAIDEELSKVSRARSVSKLIHINKNFKSPLPIFSLTRVMIVTITST